MLSVCRKLHNTPLCDLQYNMRLKVSFILLNVCDIGSHHYYWCNSVLEVKPQTDEIDVFETRTTFFRGHMKCRAHANSIFPMVRCIFVAAFFVLLTPPPPPFFLAKDSINSVSVRSIFEILPLLS